MRYSVCHHSATSRDRTGDAGIAKFTYYNRIIKNDGTVITRHDDWHARGNEHESKDYCLIGNFMTEQPTEAQLTSLKKVLGDYPIIGHRQIKEKGFTVGVLETLCPGDNLFKLLPILMSDTKKIDIDYVGNRQDKMTKAFKDMQSWYKARDISIGISDNNGDEWATVLGRDGLRASGGCRNSNPYLINLTVGLAMPYLTVGDIFIHEIMHGLFFEANLGDIHDIQTPEHPRGMTLRTAKDNEYNFNFYKNKLNTMKQIIGDEKTKRQYLLGDDGLYRWIYNVTLLNELHDAGIVDKHEVSWIEIDATKIVNTWAVIK